MNRRDAENTENDKRANWRLFSLRPLRLCGSILLFSALTLLFTHHALTDELVPVDVEGQPLAANVSRVIQALDMLGHPLPADVAASLGETAKRREAERLQELLDQHVLLAVNINPESRVKVARGPAAAILQQAG